MESKRPSKGWASVTEMPIKSSFVGQVGDKILLKASREELVRYVTELRIDDTTKHIHLPSS